MHEQICLIAKTRIESIEERVNSQPYLTKSSGNYNSILRNIDPYRFIIL